MDTFGDLFCLLRPLETKESFYKIFGPSPFPTKSVRLRQARLLESQAFVLAIHRPPNLVLKSRRRSAIVFRRLIIGIEVRSLHTRRAHSGTADFPSVTLQLR